MHNRLSIQSIFFANYRPIITSCQNFYTLGGEERRRIERMMSMCFTWFPIWFRRTQYIPRFGGVLQVYGDFTWRQSDCEELVVPSDGASRQK